MLTVLSSLTPFLGQTAGSPGVVTYFLQSNLAGQVIIFLLAFFSLLAWTIMLGKHLELKKIRALNHAYERRLSEQASLFDLPESLTRLRDIPYADMVADAVGTHRRAARRRIMGGDGAPVDAAAAVRARIEHAENALQRALAKHSLRYESSMVFLASIVAGAPFFGLLGTVWGVMDAFGAVALQSSASIQTLAPGVSGALLTTVAGLLVAIPSVFGYNYLVVRTRQMVTELENYASSLADRLELEALQSPDMTEE